MAVHALRADLVQLLSATDELLVECLDCAFLTSWLTEPIQGEGDADDGEKHQAESEGAVKLAPFEFLIGDVRTAVRGEFEFGPDLLASTPHVEHDRHAKADEYDGEHHPTDG